MSFEVVVLVGCDHRSRHVEDLDRVAVVRAQHRRPSSDGYAGLGKREPARIDRLLSIPHDQQTVRPVTGDGVQHLKPDEIQILHLVDDHRPIGQIDLPFPDHVPRH